MSDVTPQQAIFEGLVFDENGRPLLVVYVGGVPHYVVDDSGFKRHIEAHHIDQQVLDVMQSQIDQNKEALEEGMLNMMGQDDLFTKAAVGSSLGQIDKMLEKGLPAEARQWLGVMGFRIVVDVHGEVVEIEGGGIVGESDE